MERRRRTALVTGGARGIGAAIAAALAADAVDVAVADLDAEAAARVAAALPSGRHLGLAMDVTDEAVVAAGFERVQQALGPIDILVTCAGILLFAPGGDRPLVAETRLEDWRRTQEVNATGCFLACREYVRRAPVENPTGRIVTLSSVAAQLGGYRSSAAYIASKSAVLGLTKALARELAPRRITANSVAPGLIDAPMLRLSLDAADDAKAAANIPLGRIGTPGDVAGAVRFLASAEASYLTGVTIDVNGGYRMQ
ncbi:NAD(P)-dependent dehydrogenase, short-chain alcohol dehydrogenase family [Roseomonas rosea]|uniref:NAD(P)-dependent dehydrogenase, short-chain alcohol dehydrogenase family n=1 Tax=Muricoccus roseus TaxID=198092 RepID=A0A1M6LSE7_9PROT|nr:SDR family NAD(P)-dependent oxidoreductase [Roseomonas rosea]SHJ74109.1 NAD(P)-dependent dehydrogenase, short-chain alcohol dehydrogenase family [Roseomonas rosea]